MSSKSVVVDANIVIRAVLGDRVRNLIIQHYQTVDFFVPDICIVDAHKYIPQIFDKRKMPSEPAISFLEKLEKILSVVDQ